MDATAVTEKFKGSSSQSQFTSRVSFENDKRSWFSFVANRFLNERRRRR